MNRHLVSIVMAGAMGALAAPLAANAQPSRGVWTGPQVQTIAARRAQAAPRHYVQRGFNPAAPIIGAATGLIGAGLWAATGGPFADAGYYTGYGPGYYYGYPSYGYNQPYPAYYGLGYRSPADEVW